MAKLYFRYSTMGAGKSLDLLKTAHNYEERKKKVFLLTSSLDNRYGKKKIASRLGISRDANVFNKESDLYDIVFTSYNPTKSEYKDIADTLGKNLSTIKSQIRNGRHILIEQTQKEFSEIDEMYL